MQPKTWCHFYLGDSYLLPWKEYVVCVLILWKFVLFCFFVLFICVLERVENGKKAPWRKDLISRPFLSILLLQIIPPTPPRAVNSTHLHTSTYTRSALTEGKFYYYQSLPYNASPGLRNIPTRVPHLYHTSMWCIVYAMRWLVMNAFEHSGSRIQTIQELILSSWCFVFCTVWCRK